jgi:carboxylesterase type B
LVSLKTIYFYYYYVFKCYFIEINFNIILYCMISGLFHRAILLSGSALSSWALVEQPVTYALRLARQLNCSLPADTRRDHERIVDCLRAAPLDALVRADVTPPAYMSAFGPSIDGVVIRAGFKRDLVAGSRKRSSGNAGMGSGGGGGGGG